MVSQERQIMSFYSRKCAKCRNLLKYCSKQNWVNNKPARKLKRLQNQLDVLDFNKKPHLMLLNFDIDII